MSDNNNANLQVGGLVGAAGAAALSWAKFHSIGWAIWSALWGWLYIFYYVIRYVIF